MRIRLQGRPLFWRGIRPPARLCLYTTRGDVTSENGELIIGSSLIPVNSPRSEQSAPSHPELPLDTWHWVRSLSTSGVAGMWEEKSMPSLVERERAEALLTVFQRIISFRIHQWQERLATKGRLHQDMHLLRAIVAELTRQHATLIGRLDGEQRVRFDRLSSDLHGAIDTLRDITVTSRTDLSLAVNAFRAESREDGQRLEMELHRLEGRLAAHISQFKSDSENVKVRSMYSFARKHKNGEGRAGSLSKFLTL